MSKDPTIALIGGEGIGPEVVEAAAKVISHLLPQAKLVRPPHGPEAVRKFGKQVPDDSAQT